MRDAKNTPRKNVVENPLKRKLDRRTALSTAGKVAIGVVVAGVIGGIGGYFAGSAAAPTVTVTETKRETVTATSVSTKTVTVAATTSAPAAAGKEYVVKLRPGLYFADGTPVTAHDVVRSIDRVAKIEGDPAWFVLDILDDWKAVDDATVKFTLKEPYAFFPAIMAVPPYFPVHPDYKPDEIDSDQTAGGVGPYRIAKWTRDVELILETNPYWYAGMPKTKEVIVRFYKDATALRMALEAGEIDIAWRTLRPTDIQDLKKKEGIVVEEAPGGAIRYIVFNTKIPPFDDPKVRKALAAALDRKAICEKVYLGTYEPLYSMIPMGMWSHKDSFKEKYGERNLELAKKLLQEAGYSPSNKLKIELWYTPTHYGDTEVDVATMIKQSWEETGMVEVELKSAEWTTYLEYTRKGTLGATLYGWYPDYIDPDDYTWPFVNEAGRWLGGAYVSEELGKLLSEARVKTSTEERAAIYEKVQDIWAEDAVIVPFAQGKLTIAYRKGVKGIVLDPTLLLRYWLIYKEEGGSLADRVIIGVTDKVTDLDPANAYDFFTWEVLNNIMSGMTRYIPGTTDLELGIAASYSAV